MKLHKQRIMKIWSGKSKFHASLLWPWPWSRDLESRSWHTVSPQGTFMPNMKLHKWRIGKIWSGQKNSMQVYRDLELGNVTLGQGHNTPSQQKEYLCQIWKCNYNMLRKYGPDKQNSMQVYCDLDLGVVTLGQGHDTPSHHKEHSCQIWSSINKG